MARNPHAISYLTGNYWLAWSDRDAFDDALIDALHVRRDAATEVGALLKRIGVFDFRGQSERGLYHHATLCLVVYGFAVMAAEEEDRFAEDMLDRLASGFGEGQ